MAKATKQQIKDFKEQFCRNEQDRVDMINHFEIRVNSFEELIPDKGLRSYAYGERVITDSIMIFDVYDGENDILYNPVFSETVGRDLLHQWHMGVPRKKRLFMEDVDRDGAVAGNQQNEHGERIGIRQDVSELMRLVVYTRSMLVFHVDEPRPMDGVLKEIYDGLERNPCQEVCPSRVKAVNTIIRRYIQKENGNSDHFGNLQDYIVFLRTKYPEKRLPNLEFVSLRNIMANNYPDEHIYF